MATSTTGIEPRFGSRLWRDVVELLSSMRFSISLLTLICIASVIGTVVKQNEPAVNYVNQFGPFWSQVFATVGLTQVYSAWWFLLILAFLVVSTSLCVARNAPKILTDLRQYKENIREESLKSFHHKGEANLTEPLAATYTRITTLLSGQGWRAKVQERRDANGALLGHMVAARKGATNKLGYIAAHSAIVLICVGGLFDGDLVVRMQMWWQGKSSYAGDGFVRDVPAQHRLGANTLSFRANLEVPEGSRRSTAIISQQNGVVLQELPFDIELKKFVVDYYATGMPKLFASEIVIHDHESGQAKTATVKVNEPAFHRGVAIYQSSFNDGGSHLTLQAAPMTNGTKAFTIEGNIGTAAPLPLSDTSPLTIEFTGLRTINVENFANASAQGTDVRKVDLVGSLQSHLGSGVKTKITKELRNVGPSVSYKLRDSANQAREFNNYMLPVELDGQRVMLAGVRDKPEEEFRYLRIPVDESNTIDDWIRLRQALQNPQARKQAIARYVQTATPNDKPEMSAQLTQLATLAMSLFVGADDEPLSGLPAMAQYLEKKVPETERNRISELMLRVLSSCLFELLNTSRTQAKLPPLRGEDAATQTFMTQALLSLSDSMAYPAPVLLTLKDYQQVQASVFQVTRSPGKKWVYLGCVLLIIGVFAMFYIKERRLWIWLKPLANGTHIKTAMSTTRRTLDADAEFETLKQAILKQAPT
jgi:cytochrome c biogenesis protein